MKTVSVGWFEIPVSDMDRAIIFYNEVFNIVINKQDFGGTEMGWFPFGETSKGAPGTLIKSDENYTSSTDGVLVYFSSIDVNNELARIEKAGGEILQAKTQISEDHGYMALFLDTEGNRVALHSQK